MARLQRQPLLHRRPNYGPIHEKGDVLPVMVRPFQHGPHVSPFAAIGVQVGICAGVFESSAIVGTFWAAMRSYAAQRRTDASEYCSGFAHLSVCQLDLGRRPPRAAPPIPWSFERSSTSLTGEPGRGCTPPLPARRTKTCVRKPVPLRLRWTTCRTPRTALATST